jgi:IstB-like ATP binding protein
MFGRCHSRAARPTIDQLKALRLDGMAEALVELQNQAQAADLSHAEWLALLLDRELAHRNTKRFKSRLRSAKLRHSQAAIEDVDYSIERGDNSTRRCSNNSRQADGLPNIVTCSPLVHAASANRGYRARSPRRRVATVTLRSMLESLDYFLILNSLAVMAASRVCFVPW